MWQCPNCGRWASPDNHKCSADVVVIPAFPALVETANFALPRRWLKRAGLDDWGQIRVLENGSREITLKMADSLAPSERVFFKIGRRAPQLGDHIRRSFNDESSIFGVVVPAGYKSAVRISVA